jgi:hypothetical protein
VTLHLGPLALLVAGLLAHQLVRMWEQGFAGVHHNYAPVFAIGLPQWATFVGQVAALPVALVVVVVVPAPLDALVPVLCWLVTVQRRLANHCWLSLVALAAMALVPPAADAVVARDLLIGLYLSAALFKLNPEYLFTDRSAGRVVTGFYLRLLGLPTPRWLLGPVPVLVILAELLTGLALLSPDFAVVGLVLAIATHWAFGVSGNFSFSIVAMVLWVTAFASNADGVAFPPVTSAWWLAVPVSAALALVLGRTAAGRRSVSLLGKDLFQGAAFGALCAVALAAPPAPPAWSSPLVHVLVAALFVANFLLVLAGAKLEWSFAMFSSLRPFGRSWLQRGWIKDWPRYYLLTLPDRVPRHLLVAVQPQFLYQATRADNAVHESVVCRLEALARECDTTFAPRAVEPGNGELMLSARVDQLTPRRTVLLFPAIVPRNFTKHYLG